MKITSVIVENFRGIRSAALSDLGEMVVLAGQNGSGKSCILDAIRLLKSVYGGYQQNEFHQWFGEFQINFTNDPRAFATMFNEKGLPLALQMEVKLHDQERAYLKERAKELITRQVWRTLVPELYGWRSLEAAPLTAQFRSRQDEVDAATKHDLDLFSTEIDRPTVVASLMIRPGQAPEFTPSKTLELMFTDFDPENVGVIDYHGAHRMYNREQLNAINVNLDAIEQQRRQSALYNYNAKYTNVKSEMAALYVREALAEKAGKSFDTKNSLTDTLKELFSTFFPEKEFLGPQPLADGSLHFPVKVGGRETHDLDDLSSGEKEILYGYLRLRRSAPKHSVILLDEPELHLNPRLTRNLPDFYHRHLAKELGNQVWLITHSDAILRESVGRQGVSVFHMTPSAHTLQARQAHRIEVDHDLERAIIDMVGDLAAYNPGAKVVIFEGADSDFDLRMTSELFPELIAKVNAASGTNKARVRGLHALLQSLVEGGRLPPMRVYSITDRDSGKGGTAATTQFEWDVYHIENYLLIPSFIRSALNDLLGGRDIPSEDEIEDELRTCAKDTLQSLVLHDSCDAVNNEMIAAINTKIDPKSTNPGTSLFEAIEASRNRIDALIRDRLSPAAVENLVETHQERFRTDLQNGTWKSSFRGRDILRLFVGKRGAGVKYETFRNVVIARMRDSGYQPSGMKAILDRILAPQHLGQL
ncbi:ATP-binding protein [Bradyrhizobium ontarionense]|uniref:ATP-binding protein n=1 Tax=Bradyrhizobium ontarionense TaxID=2898149 RepID=A0ABY3R7X3_9BRAD|nr:ATP-binding protein [Bradyrhizobium sp. A19]UFZ03430.1 ATP-binding protein [Bradyrhizobium sp. A19]